MRKVQIYAFILAGMLLLWYTAQANLKTTQGSVKVTEDFKEVPLELKDWTGISLPVDEVSQQGLPNAALLNREYENNQGYDTNLTVVYGVDLGVFHQPEYCMEGQGWKRTKSRMVKISSKQPHDAVIMQMVNDYNSIIVLYWFASEGTVTTKLQSQKVAALLGRLKSELKTAAMIRLITPIDGDPKAAERVTLDLASQVDPFISKMLSKPPKFEHTSSGLEE